MRDSEFARDALAAIGSVAAEIEVKMVGVLRIGVRAEPDRETAAPRIVDRAKEAPDILVRSVPALEDGDPAAVGQHEGGDVDGCLLYTS